MAVIRVITGGYGRAGASLGTDTCCHSYHAGPDNRYKAMVCTALVFPQ